MSVTVTVTVWDESIEEAVTPLRPPLVTVKVCGVSVVVPEVVVSNSRMRSQ